MEGGGEWRGKEEKRFEEWRELVVVASCSKSQQNAKCTSKTDLPDHCACCTLGQKPQIKLTVSPSHSILTPGQPAPALILRCQIPGRIATSILIFKLLV